MTEPVSEREARLRRLVELGELSQDDYAMLTASEMQEIATNTGSGAIAQGQGSTAASDHSLAIGGNVYGDVYQGPAPKDSNSHFGDYPLK